MPVSKLRTRLYALAFVDEFGPLYALFTLWFNDNGVSTGQISTAFVLWAAVAIVLEVPSGVLADQVDRRRLLAFAFGLRAGGIVVWLLSPNFAGLLIGAMTWAVHSALASGAWEAHIHDQLTAADQAALYGTVKARVGQFSNLGIAASALLAFGLVELGVSIAALGWLTVAIHFVSMALVLTMPDVRWVALEAQSQEPAYRAWLVGLRAGFQEVLSSAVVLRIVLLGALVEGLFVVDEYVPLLARDRGVADATVSLFVLAVWSGLLVGDELAARWPSLGGRPLGLAVVVGSVAMLAAILSNAAAALILIGVGYAALEALWTLGDARLQERVGSGNRATVSSVRGVLTGLVGAVAFSGIGLLSNGDDPSPGLILVASLLMLVGLLTLVWLPSALAEQKDTAQ